MSVQNKSTIVELKPGVNSDISNVDYHAEKLHLSSSNLKLILQSPSQFHKEKILGQRESKSSTAMDLGTYVHTLVLEPEKAAQEVAIYPGWTRKGPEYTQFLEQNPGKLVLSQPQAHNGQRLANTVKACPPAINLLKGGVPELSLATQMLDVPVKCRADYINPDAGYIVDIKTTRWPGNIDTFRRTVKELGYELSAALYCDIAYRVYGKIFDFYWVVISKEDFQCDVYKASTHTLAEGSALVTKALVTYKKCLSTNSWPDTVEELSKQTNAEHEILEI